MIEVAIIDKRTLSNGAIAVTFRPNGDPAHDSTGTFYTAGRTVADVQAWAEKEKRRVAAEYDAHQTAHLALEALK